jgi:riboflavin biosynthesis pyrimidine reductase
VSSSTRSAAAIPGVELNGAELGGAAWPRLEVLHEEDLPAFDLPADLERAYGGALGFDEPRLYANFVSTIDGVVAIPGLPRANRVISGDSESDRFVMGLLRACADVVLLGSGTLHGSPRSLWTPERAYPPAAASFAELRRRLGRSPEPELAVLTGSGKLDPAHPALEHGALVLTTDAGAAHLEGRLPGATTVVSLGGGAVLDPRDAVDALRERGHRLILSEAGPRLFGALVAAGLVNELFLTFSPLLAGRMPLDGRLALVEDADLVPAARPEARLLSARRDGAHLFLRYQL